MPKARTRLLTAFAAVYLIWGSTYLAIRFAIETIPPFLMAGFRFLLAGAVMYWLVRLRGASRPTVRQWLWAAVVGALLLLGGNGGVVWAEQTVPSGQAALLVATEPLWVVLIDWVRPGGERPLRGEVVGLALGFAGVAVLITPAGLFGAAFEVDLVGAAVLVFAALAWAAGSVVSRQAPAHESSFVAAAMMMLTGGVLLVIAGTFTGEWARLDVAAITLRSWFALAYLVVFGALIGFTAYVWLLKNTTLARASTYAYVNPIVAVILGWMLAAEPLNSRVMVAAGIIVSGVVIVVRSHRQEMGSGV